MVRGGGLFTENSDSWRALETEHLSLLVLCEEKLEGGSFTRDPEGYEQEGSGDRHLFP